MREGFRGSFGEVMEGSFVTAIVTVLIIIDLFCTLLKGLLESTDMLNPKYGYWGRACAGYLQTISVCILVTFLVEQMLHVLAFGWEFFEHRWMVMDVCIVFVSLLFETVLNGSDSKQWIGLLAIMRLWKVIAFVFDVLLAWRLAAKNQQPAQELAIDTNTVKHQLTKKLSTSSLAEPSDSLYQSLGEFLESSLVRAVVIPLIILDLVCTVINDGLENTDLLNPKYNEQGEYLSWLTHNTCVAILCIFLVEQLLHLLAFGWQFFTHFWMVSDLFVVSISLICETALEDWADNGAEDSVGLLVALRLWKLSAFTFDLLLLEHELREA